MEEANWKTHLPGKLKAICSNPHGEVTIRSQRDGHDFEVNGQRLKHDSGQHDLRNIETITLGDALACTLPVTQSLHRLFIYF